MNAQGELREMRTWLKEKVDAGVKDVRAKTMLARVEAAIKAAREFDKEDRKPKKSLRATNGRSYTLEELSQLEWVGTREAAELLNVERPRIGRWRNNGIMPEPIAEPKSGPVWLKVQIEAMAEERKKRSRKPKADADAPDDKPAAKQAA